MSTGEMIVKIQRPLATNQNVPPAMVYNRHRTFQSMPPYETVAHLFFTGGPDKVYWNVRVDDEGFKLLSRAPEQDW